MSIIFLNSHDIQKRTMFQVESVTRLYKINIWKLKLHYENLVVLAEPGKARGCSTNTAVNNCQTPDFVIPAIPTNLEGTIFEELYDRFVGWLFATLG